MLLPLLPQKVCITLYNSKKDYLLKLNFKIMKKIIMMAVMAVAALSANAQQEAGTFSIQPKAGLTVSSLSGDGTKAKAGFTAGVEGMYQAAEKFGVSLGVMYAMQGAKSKADTDLKLNYGYINIPILANYYVVKGLAVKAGIQPGFMVSAKEKYNSVSRDVKDGCKKFDFSIPVGVSYEIANVVFDARYNFGLTKTVKDVEKGKNGVFTFTVGYKFGL
jgi:hypothetical protein